jgi:hypothetical protein
MVKELRALRRDGYSDHQKVRSWCALASDVEPTGIVWGGVHHRACTEDDILVEPERGVIVAQEELTIGVLDGLEAVLRPIQLERGVEEVHAVPLEHDTSAAPWSVVVQSIPVLWASVRDYELTRSVAI